MRVAWALRVPRALCCACRCSRASLATFAAEIGATTSLFPLNQRQVEFLNATGRPGVAEAALRHAHLLTPDAGCTYDRLIEICLDELVPALNGPYTPDLWTPVAQMGARAAKEGWPQDISSGLIGSCTNSSYEDMAKCAALARQALSAGLRFKVPFYVTPGSRAVQLNISREGFVDTFEAAGAVVLAKACGPCIGQWKRKVLNRHKSAPGPAARCDGRGARQRRKLGWRPWPDASRHATPAHHHHRAPTQLPPGTRNTIVSSYNRNFAKRNDGNTGTHSFVASPELVTMLSFSGQLGFNPYADALPAPDGGSFRFAKPKGVDALPPSGWATDLSVFQSPPADSSSTRVEVSPSSDRLQLLEPFPPWEGTDFLGCPVLIKARGQCTTDHISMAGSWLKFRGHLSNISNNLLIGAVNAETGATNAVTSQVAHPRIRRDQMCADTRAAAAAARATREPRPVMARPGPSSAHPEAPSRSLPAHPRPRAVAPPVRSSRARWAACPTSHGSTAPPASSGWWWATKTTARARRASTLRSSRATSAGWQCSPAPLRASTRRTSRSRACSRSPSLSPPTTTDSRETTGSRFSASCS